MHNNYGYRYERESEELFFILNKANGLYWPLYAHNYNTMFNI